jgi:hypothetical protein
MRSRDVRRAWQWPATQPTSGDRGAMRSESDAHARLQETEQKRSAPRTPKRHNKAWPGTNAANHSGELERRYQASLESRGQLRLFD